MRGLRGLARRMGQGAASGGADKGAGDGGGHGLSGAVVPIQGAERALRGAVEGAAFLCSELFSRGSKRPHLQPPRTKVAGGDPRGISKGAPGEAARARPPGDGRSPFSAFVCCPSPGGWRGTEKSPHTSTPSSQHALPCCGDAAEAGGHGEPGLCHAGSVPAAPQDIRVERATGSMRKRQNLVNF